MAIYELACNLSSALFAFASSMWGKSVIVPLYDTDYNKTIFSSIDPGFEKGVPQVFYMHNVMPTTEGFKSIGYDTLVTGFSALGTSGAFGAFNFGNSGFENSSVSSMGFDRAFTIETLSQNFFIFVPAGGKNFIYDATINGWTSVSAFPPNTVPDNCQVTTAFVAGQTYICYANYGVFVFNETTRTLNPQVLIGLDLTQIISICSASGYLVAITKTGIVWSSLTNALDFTPSLLTGAGGGNIADAKGHLVSIARIAGGFIVYCENNAVGATYSGNINFPFIFLEVAGSGGLKSLETLTWSSNMTSHILYGSHGIQEITKLMAKPVYSELGEFFSARIFEDFDEVSNLLSSKNLTSAFSIRLTMVQNRFLVASYGVQANSFTHAMVYDMTLKRWGKLKITHVDCLEWNAPNLYGNITYGMLINTTYADLAATTYKELNTQADSFVEDKKSIAFLQVDGTLKRVNFDYGNPTSYGIFIIGKFQFRRRQRIQHQYSTVESIATSNNFELFVIPTNDGKTFLPPVSTRLNERLSKGLSRTYQRIVDGWSVALLFKGNFNLSSLLISFTSGSRK